MGIRIKRLIAASTDMYIIMFITTVATLLIRGADVADNPTDGDVLLFFGLIFGMLLFKDCLFTDASIGKKMVGIHIVRLNEKQSIFVTSLKRFLPLLLIGIEPILMIITNKRLGDIWAKTVVIETYKKVSP